MQVTIQTTQTSALSKSEVLRVATRAVCEAAAIPFDTSSLSYDIVDDVLVKISKMYDGTPYNVKVRKASDTDRAVVHVLKLLKP